MEEESPRFVKYIAIDASTCIEKVLQKKIDALIKIIWSDEFDGDSFASWISGTEDYERIYFDRCKAILKEDGFCLPPVRNDGSKGRKYKFCT